MNHQAKTPTRPTINLKFVCDESSTQFQFKSDGLVVVAHYAMGDRIQSAVAGMTIVQARTLAKEILAAYPQ